MNTPDRRSLDAGASFDKGFALWRGDDLVGAKAAFQHAAEAGRCEAWVWLATLQVGAGERPAVEAALSALLAQSPGVLQDAPLPAGAQKQLADLLRWLDRPDLAAAAQAAGLSDPAAAADPTAWRALAAALERLGRLEEGAALRETAAAMGAASPADAFIDRCYAAAADRAAAAARPPADDGGRPDLIFNPWRDDQSAIAACVDRYGVALLRGLLSPSWVAAAAALGRAAFLSREARHADQSLDPTLAYQLTVVGSVALEGPGREDVSLDGVSLSEVFCAPYFQGLAARLTGAAGMTLFAPEMRRSDPAGLRAVPFHQDTHVAGERMVNVWIPLQDCGRDSPGLSFLPLRVSEIEPTISGGEGLYAQLGFEIDPAHIASKFPGLAEWAPAYRPGDALVFHSAVIHRTYIAPGMTRERLSLEGRYLDESTRRRSMLEP